MEGYFRRYFPLSFNYCLLLLTSLTANLPIQNVADSPKTEDSDAKPKSHAGSSEKKKSGKKCKSNILETTVLIMHFISFLKKFLFYLMQTLNTMLMVLTFTVVRFLDF